MPQDFTDGKSIVFKLIVWFPVTTTTTWTNADQDLWYHMEPSDLHKLPVSTLNDSDILPHNI